MKNSSHVMKYLKMTNKLKVSVCAMVEKIGSFSFRWLRRVFQQLISHRKAHLSEANTFNVGPASIFDLGEKFTSCSFQWFRRGLEHLISHRKGSSLVD